MLDGRRIIEVRWANTSHDMRVWVVRYSGSQPVICQGVRTVDGDWLAVSATGPAERVPSLRDLRKYFFRGNGRLTGGHSEIGESGAVRAPMSLINVMALCLMRPVPGLGEYWV